MKMPPDLESLKKSPELLKKEINELEAKAEEYMKKHKLSAEDIKSLNKLQQRISTLKGEKTLLCVSIGVQYVNR